MNARYLLMHVQWNMINVLKKTVELHPIVHFLSIYFISSFFTDFFWDFIGLIIKFCYYIYWINLQWNMINVLKKTVELHPIVHFLSIYFISSFFTDFFWDFIGLIIKFCYYIYWINLIPFFIYFFLFFVVLKRSSWSCTNINFNIFLLIKLILKF